MAKAVGATVWVAFAWAIPDSRTFRSGGKRIACQQFALNCRNLSVNHSKQVELTAACEGKVLHGVCKCLWMRGVLQRSHEYKQRTRGFIAAATDYLCPELVRRADEGESSDDTFDC